MIENFVCDLIISAGDAHFSFPIFTNIMMCDSLRERLVGTIAATAYDDFFDGTVHIIDGIELEGQKFDADVTPDELRKYLINFESVIQSEKAYLTDLYYPTDGPAQERFKSSLDLVDYIILLNVNLNMIDLLNLFLNEQIDVYDLAALIGVNIHDMFRNYANGEGRVTCRHLDLHLYCHYTER